MKFIFFSCCSNAIVDAQSGMVSCINIYDSIKSPQFPLVIPQFSIVAIANKEAKDKKINKCELSLSLDREELFKKTFTIDFPEKARGSKAVIGIQGLVIEKTGILNVSFLDDEGSEITNWSIPVTQNTVG